MHECIYININTYVYIERERDYTAKTSVLPSEMRFDCAGPVFFEIQDVVHLPETRNQTPKLIYHI